MVKSQLLTAAPMATVLAGLLVGCNYAVPAKTPVPSTPPAPDMARVYFINLGGPLGDNTTFILKETELIGYLENEKAAFVELPEGEHFFISVASNVVGLLANLAGGRTYYLRLTAEPGPPTALGGETINTFFDPIVPGDEFWEKRHEWINHAQLVALNEKRAATWNERWAVKNEERFMKFKRGEETYSSLNPDQGE